MNTLNDRHCGTVNLVTDLQQFMPPHAKGMSTIEYSYKGI